MRYIHNIDPIIVSVGGIHLWWYGLSFTLGFLSLHFFLRRNRDRLALTLDSVYTLTLFIAAGILIGGRALVVVNNEWDFYREHMWLVPAIWIGGFASHGLIVGGAAGVGLFRLVYKKPFRPIFDVLAIAACLILGWGRIGNFIDGQIYGSLTDFPLAVRFPEAEGFRHPVVLYDGLKNFLLAPVLLLIRNRGVPDGRIAALFVVLYSGLRIPIDTLRDYPISMWGLPTGQTLNFLMLGAGIVLLLVNIRRRRDRMPEMEAVPETGPPSAWKKIAFGALLLIPLVIPSDATRDIPHRYGTRHLGLVHSWMYPAIADRVNQ
ncbi:MAG TPA: prolipoprotein diacylglyceryl transferase [Aridibacter sp.]|nr:prolipoprotein diacylglyceryl transferase [Aridibacter sp.]